MGAEARGTRAPLCERWAIRLNFKRRGGHAPDGLGGALEAEAELEVEVILVGRGLGAHLLLGRRLRTRGTRWGKRVKMGKALGVKTLYVDDGWVMERGTGTFVVR